MNDINKKEGATPRNADKLPSERLTKLNSRLKAALEEGKSAGKKTWHHELIGLIAVTIMIALYLLYLAILDLLK